MSNLIRCYGIVFRKIDSATGFAIEGAYTDYKAEEAHININNVDIYRWFEQPLLLINGNKAPEGCYIMFEKEMYRVNEKEFSKLF